MPRPQTSDGSISRPGTGARAFNHDRPPSVSPSMLAKTSRSNSPWKEVASRKLAFKDKHNVMLAVLDATADAILAPGSSPNGELALELSPATAPTIRSTPGAGVVSRRGKPSQWDQHASSRSVGVRALQQLAARHTVVKAEKAECEAMAHQVAQQQQHHLERIAGLEHQCGELAVSLAAAQAQVREAAAREKEKDQLQARAIDVLKQTKAQEARGLLVELEKQRAAQTATKAALGSSEERLLDAEDERELLRRRVKELEDDLSQMQARAALLEIAVQEADRDISNMDRNFYAARERLSSVNAHVLNMERAHASKTEALGERISVLENIFKEEVATRQRSVHERDAARAEAEELRAALTNEETVLEAKNRECEQAMAASQAAAARAEAAESEVHALRQAARRRVVVGHWIFLSARAALAALISHEQEAAKAAELCGRGEAAVQTEPMRASTSVGRGVVARPGMDDWLAYFKGVLKQALALSAEEALRGEWLMPVPILLHTISMLYSRKAVMDQIDDRQHRARQHLAFFVYDHFVSQARCAAEGAAAFVRLVVNLVQYLPREAPGGKGEESSARLEAWLAQVKLDRFHLQRVQTFATLMGANPLSKWDVGFTLEAADVYLETLVRVRKGLTPLLPEQGTESSSKELLVPMAEMKAVLETVCSHMKSIDRQTIKVEIETELKVQRPGGPRGGLVNLDKALKMVVDYWKTLCYDSSSARLQSLFVSADTDQSGELDYTEFADMIDKIRNAGFAHISPRSVLRIYSQMSLGSRVDASIFCDVAYRYDLGKVPVGTSLPGGKASTEMEQRETIFKLLKGHWEHLEPKVLPVVSALKNSSHGLVMQELILLMRAFMDEQQYPAHAMHAFRIIVAELPPAVRSEIQQSKDFRLVKRAKGDDKKGEDARPASKDRRQRGASR